MIHTIGVSFTAEMLAKAAYEETIGRATAWLRGPRKTPQDAVIAGDGRRLRGVPAPDAVVPVSVQSQGARALGGAGRSGPFEDGRRRLGIGLEFQAKAAYAKVIAGAVAATAPAQLVIRSVVSGLDRGGPRADSRMSR